LKQSGRIARKANSCLTKLATGLPSNTIDPAPGS
jgi:hypothetical protein